MQKKDEECFLNMLKLVRNENIFLFESLLTQTLKKLKLQEEQLLKEDLIKEMN